MKIKTLFLVFWFFCMQTSFCQDKDLLGTVTISLKDNTINSRFFITNTSTKNNELAVVINSQIKIVNASLNAKKIRVKKQRKNCYDCNYYSIQLKKPLKDSDTIKLKTKGYFKSYSNGSHKNDYKGKIVSNYGILRASEQSKWYPVIVNNNTKSPLTFQKKLYNYKFKANCSDCKYIYIGDGSPKKSGSTFSSNSASENIMLIAGNYNVTETNQAIYLNLEDKNIQAIIDTTFLKVNTYYESLTGIKIPQKFTFALLPSDNKRWGGFFTYPTIVKVNKPIRIDGISDFISHEVAHYFFGNHFKPSSNLYWFYLESFAEYFSYKYLLKHDISSFKKSYAYFKKNHPFYRLDEVKNISDLKPNYYYNTAAFQLLAIENSIGEKKMIAFINTIFSQLKNNENGYKVLINSLKAVNVSNQDINYIDNNIIKTFNLSEYKFLENKN